MSKKLILFLLLAVFLLCSCSKTPSPRGVVMNFIEAVYQSDRNLIEKYADTEGYALENLKDYPTEKKNELLPKMKEEILKSLIEDGAIRIKWRQRRIVVGNEYIKGKEAEVEVTYMNPENGTSVFEKVKLHKVEGIWKIYYFKG
jgi:hypothetical protein